MSAGCHLTCVCFALQDGGNDEDAEEGAEGEAGDEQDADQAGEGSDEDQDDSEDEDAPNVMACQFEKVHRVKNRWTVNFVNGSMLLNGKEMLFSKATGVMEF